MPRDPLAEAATLLMLRHASDRSVAVIIFDEHGDQIDRGSGVCIRLADRYLVGTAAHLVDKAKLGEIGLLSSWEPTNATPKLLGFNHRGGAGQALDVAWLEVDPRCLGRLGRSFVTLDRISLATFPSPTTAFVYGCPAERTKEPIRNGRVLTQVNPIGYLTRTTSAIPAEYHPDPKTEVFLEYPDDINEDVPAGWLKKVPDAPGLSGAGLWSIGVRDGEFWSVESSRLVGIQNAWSESDRLLRGTVIRHWLEMVREDIPALASVIDPVLGGSPQL